MRGLFRSLIIIGALLEIYWLLPPRPLTTTPSNLRVGAFHIRSPIPLTHEKLELLTAKAKQSGIHFLVIADPKSSHARSLGLEGNYDGVDVYIELEAHLTAGHAVVFYSHTAARELSDEALNRAAWKHFLGTDPRPGMFLVVAHPDSQSAPWNRLDRFSEGIELLNLNTLFQNQQESGPLSLLMSALIFPFSNYLAVLRSIQIPEKNLQGWDAINAVSQGHFGVAAQEISSDSFFPSWIAPEWSVSRALLPSVLNAVQLSEPVADTFEARRQQTYEALQRGRSAIFFPLRYPQFETTWELKCPNKTFFPGDTVPSAVSDCQFELALSSQLLERHPNVRFLKDGKVITQWESLAQSPITTPLQTDSPGAYRLEIGIPTRTPLGILLNREVPYAFYNPLYVR